MEAEMLANSNVKKILSCSKSFSGELKKYIQTTCLSPTATAVLMFSKLIENQ